MENGENFTLAHPLLLVPFSSRRFDDIINDAEEDKDSVFVVDRHF